MTSKKAMIKEVIDLMGEEVWTAEELNTMSTEELTDLLEGLKSQQNGTAEAAPETPVEPQVSVLDQIKAMDTELIRRSAQLLTVAATGEDPDKTNWDAYDRDGLLEVIQLRLPQVKSVVVTEGAEEPISVKAKGSRNGTRARKAPKARFAPDSTVYVDGKEDDPWTVLASTATDSGFTYRLANNASNDIREDVAEELLSRGRKQKVKGEGRKRSVSNELVIELRARYNNEEGMSYGKLRDWLKDEKGVTVSPQLVRNIVLGNLYTDVA